MVTFILIVLLSNKEMINSMSADANYIMLVLCLINDTLLLFRRK